MRSAPRTLLSQAAAVRLAIEIGTFAADMNHKEHRSLANQLTRAYGLNKQAPSPLSLHLTGLDRAPPLALPADAHLQRWTSLIRIGPSAEDYFAPDELVWLSPDAEEPLLELDARHVYVVGGLVDRSRRSSLSRARARERNLPALRLPLREHAPRPNVDPVLSIVAVVQALGAVHSGASWGDALELAVPKRYVARRDRERERRLRDDAEARELAVADDDVDER